MVMVVLVLVILVVYGYDVVYSRLLSRVVGLFPSNTSSVQEMLLSLFELYGGQFVLGLRVMSCVVVIMLFSVSRGSLGHMRDRHCYLNPLGLSWILMGVVLGISNIFPLGSCSDHTCVLCPEPCSLVPGFVFVYPKFCVLCTVLSVLESPSGFLIPLSPPVLPCHQS